MTEIHDKTPEPLRHLKGTIFVVTYGRSGSTLLQSILQTIPNSHIVGENFMALEGLFLASQRVRKSHRIWGKKARPNTHPWYGADQFEPNRFEARLTRLFIEEVIQPPEDARWIGFKEIRYPRLADKFPFFLEFCLRSFPNPFFVFNSRNGEDVAKSKWWVKHTREHVLEMVSTMDDLFSSYAEEYPDRAHHVFHEQTCSDLPSLQPLFDKLGEPFDIAKAREILATPLTH